RTARLFPLLHGVIRTPHDYEKPLEVDRRRKGPRQRHGELHELERLFIGPRFQQSIREVDRTADVYPTALALLRERERPAATAHAVVRLTTMHLRESQQRTAQGFCRAIRQGLGERGANGKGGK